MQQRKFLSQARRELIGRGVIGSNMSSLLEEWKEHLQIETESLLESGHSQEEAEFQACELLGAPDKLAELATIQYHQSSWQGRHPWLSSVVIGVSLFISCLAAYMCVFGTMMEFSIQPINWNPVTLQALLLVMNWLPWTLGMGWLVLHARRMPAGWKGFWGVTGGVVLCFNSMSIVVSSGGNGVALNGVPGVLLWAGFNMSGNGHLFVDLSYPFMLIWGAPIIQILITLGYAVYFQRYVKHFHGSMGNDFERA